jgi:hypothetical protein
MCEEAMVIGVLYDTARKKDESVLYIIIGTENE